MTVSARSLIARAKDHSKLVFFFTLSSLLSIIFMWLAAGVAKGENFSFDHPILLFLHSFTSPFLNTFFTAITHLGDHLTVIVLTTGLGLYCAHKKAYQNSLILFMGVAGALAANIIIKSLVQRDRPSLWEHIVTETHFSFPSGHAMGSAALATALIIIFWKTRYRWLVMVMASIITVLIALSRLYLGVHYPSDILAGWCVSIVGVLLVAVVISYFPRRSKG